MLRVRSLLIVPMAITLLGSDCGGSGLDLGLGGDCRTVRFTLTPDGGTAFDADLRACTHAPVTEGCGYIVLYDMPGDSYFQYTLDDALCIDGFNAEIEVGGVVYSLYGTPLRQFGSGSGPFASGSYYLEGSSASGSFTFHEFEFHESGMIT
jgi:hypothetical protein